MHSLLSLQIRLFFFSFFSPCDFYHFLLNSFLFKLVFTFVCLHPSTPFKSIYCAYEVTKCANPIGCKDAHKQSTSFQLSCSTPNNLTTDSQGCHHPKKCVFLLQCFTNKTQWTLRAEKSVLITRAVDAALQHPNTNKWNWQKWFKTDDAQMFLVACC